LNVSGVAHVKSSVTWTETRVFKVEKYSSLKLPDMGSREVVFWEFEHKTHKRTHWTCLVTIA